MFEFKLPDLGEGVHEGEVLQWHVKPGDTIGEDEPLLEVETDKAAVTIPSPRAGKIVSTTGKVGETINVGTVVVVIDTGEGGAVAADAPDSPVSTVPSTAPPAASGEAAMARSAATSAPVASSAAPTAAAEVIHGTGPVPAAPATRRLARELGVVLRQVSPSGPGGRVTADDVRRFSEGGGAAVVSDQLAGDAGQSLSSLPAMGGPSIPFFEVEGLPDYSQYGSVERESIRSIRRKIARKMVSSMVIVPHVCHMDEADVTELEKFRKEERVRRKGQPGERLTLLAFVIKAVTVLLRERPKFNASIDPLREEILYKMFYNIGFAADTPKGLVVPVVKNAADKSIVELSEEIADLADKARSGTINVDNLRGGTFTVTNVGSLGGTGAIPTINYPEVAIVAMSRAEDKPVVRDGQIVIRKMLPMTIAFDHRIIDGADAARFMTALVQYLSNPNRLLVYA
jgi:pyruvate dehydrogenase E2 component (dihydrolipoamide acetyltransferase)